MVTGPHRGMLGSIFRCCRRPWQQGRLACPLGAGSKSPVQMTAELVEVFLLRPLDPTTLDRRRPKLPNGALLVTGGFGAAEAARPDTWPKSMAHGWEAM